MFYNKLEKSITNVLIQENHNEIEREQISFGVKIILNDLWKFIIVYLIALQLNCLLPTLITHLVFYVLRQVCFGFHFENNLICLIASVIALPIGGYFINNIYSQNNYIIIVGAILTFVLVLFAPANTAKRPVYNLEHKIYLKKKLIVRLLIIWAAIFLANDVVDLFISYGIILITISVLIQKIKGEDKNENQKYGA